MSIRILARDDHAAHAPCDRCGATDCPWDKIAIHCLCPDCQEALMAGKTDFLRAAIHPIDCAVCGIKGAVKYTTFPVHSSCALEIALCGEHLRGLVGRCLPKKPFRTLRAVLRQHGFSVDSIFLLHETFYDEGGHALQPVEEEWLC